MAEEEDLRDARTRLVRLLHLRHLGLDPDIKGFRSNEANTANALEHTVGERLERSTTVGDWRGTRTGRIYDDCSPPRYPFFDAQFDNWQQAVIGHATLKQGVQIVPVDLRNRDLTQDQIRRVVEALNALPDPARRKVLVLFDAEDD